MIISQIFFIAACLSFIFSLYKLVFAIGYINTYNKINRRIVLLKASNNSDNFILNSLVNEGFNKSLVSECLLDFNESRSKI